MALGFLDKKGMVEVVSDSACRRLKLAELTEKGQRQGAYRKLVSVIDDALHVSVLTPSIGCAIARADRYAPRSRPLSRRMARFAPQAPDVAALSDGAASGRISRRQLVAGSQ